VAEFNSTCRDCQEFDPDPEVKDEWWDGFCTKLGIKRNRETMACDSMNPIIPVKFDRVEAVREEVETEP